MQGMNPLLVIWGGMFHARECYHRHSMGWIPPFSLHRAMTELPFLAGARGGGRGRKGTRGREHKEGVVGWLGAVDKLFRIVLCWNWHSGPIVKEDKGKRAEWRRGIDGFPLPNLKAAEAIAFANKCCFTPRHNVSNYFLNLWTTRERSCLLAINITSVCSNIRYFTQSFSQGSIKHSEKPVSSVFPEMSHQMCCLQSNTIWRSDPFIGTWQALITQLHKVMLK